MSYFGIANVKSLASVLINESECTLTWLMLQNCHISGQGTHELATALHKNSTLKHLHLDHNHTGVEGASSMSDMILQNTSMKELHLKDYSIGEEGVHRLFSSLKHNVGETVASKLQIRNQSSQNLLVVWILLCCLQIFSAWSHLYYFQFHDLPCTIYFYTSCTIMWHLKQIDHWLKEDDHVTQQS